MIDFSVTTAFRLVRRLMMGQGTASMYLLLWEDGNQPVIEADLKAEFDVQMSIILTVSAVWELKDMVEPAEPVRIVRIDCWSTDLVSLLDTHVIRLERTGAQFLFLTTDAVAQQLLVEAPNFRNRLTEILRIVPDDPSGGGQY
jgi:hypothetical protein